MNKEVNFYILHNRDDGGVEFISRGDERLTEMIFKGYEIIGSGRHRNIKELNRGICANMRGMYEFEKRQNTELKIQLERALKVIREIDAAIKKSLEERRREAHRIYEDSMVRAYKALGINICEGTEKRFHCQGAQENNCISEEFKRFWDDTN